MSSYKSPFLVKSMQPIGNNTLSQRSIKKGKVAGLGEPPKKKTLMIQSDSSDD